jgi:hypothetical protein
MAGKLPEDLLCIQFGSRLHFGCRFLLCPETRIMMKLSTNIVAASVLLSCLALCPGCNDSTPPAVAPATPTYKILGPDTVPSCTIPQEHGRTYLRMIDGPADSMNAWLAVEPEALVRQALDRNIQVGDIWYPLGGNVCMNPLAVTAIIVGLNAVDTTMAKHGFVPIGDYNPYCTRPDGFRRYHFVWK